MTTDGGGNPRFKGPGMQWKTPWGRRTPFSLQMPFFEGFLSLQADPPVNRYYLGAVGQGLPGAVNGFWVGSVMFARPGTYAEVIASFGETFSPFQGWVLSADPLTGVGFSIGDGAAYTTVSAPYDTSDPSAVADALVIPILAIYDQPNTQIILYVENSDGPIIIPFAGPYETPAGGRTSFGGLYSGMADGAAHLGLNGLVGGNFIPTNTEVIAWFAAVKAALKTSAIPGKTTHLWAANDFISPLSQQVPAPVTIKDELSNLQLTLLGNDNTDVFINQYGTQFDY